MGIWLIVSGALVGMGPVGWACIAGMVLINGAVIADQMGVFDQSEVELNEDGYVVIPDVVNPNEDQNENEHGYIDDNNNNSEDAALWGFVHIAQSAVQPEIPDYYPEDVRPPTSSFAISGEAYSSGSHIWLIFGLIALLIVYGTAISRPVDDEVVA